MEFTERELVDAIAAGRVAVTCAEGKVTRAEGRVLRRLTDRQLRIVIHWQANRIWSGHGGLAPGSNKTRVRVEILGAGTAPRPRRDSPTVRLARLMKAARDRRKTKDTADWKAPQALKAVQVDYPDHELVRGLKKLSVRSARTAWVLVEEGKV
jgi:hypothetical protein